MLLSLSTLFMNQAMAKVVDVELTIENKACKATLLMPKYPKKGAVIFVNGEGIGGDRLLLSLGEYFRKRGLAVLYLDLAQFANDEPCKNDTKILQANNYLIEKKYKNIALLHYDFNSFSTYAFVMAIEPKPEKEEKIKAMVFVSAFSEKMDYQLIIEDNSLIKEKKKRIPLLDIVAEYDFNHVFQAQKSRDTELEVLGSKFYRSFILPGASHDYLSFERPLATWAINFILAHFDKPNS